MVQKLNKPQKLGENTLIAALDAWEAGQDAKAESLIGTFITNGGLKIPRLHTNFLIKVFVNRLSEQGQGVVALTKLLQTWENKGCAPYGLPGYEIINGVLRKYAETAPTDGKSNFLPQLANLYNDYGSKPTQIYIPGLHPDQPLEVLLQLPKIHPGWALELSRKTASNLCKSMATAMVQDPNVERLIETWKTLSNLVPRADVQGLLPVQRWTYGSDSKGYCAFIHRVAPHLYDLGARWLPPHEGRSTSEVALAPSKNKKKKNSFTLPSYRDMDFIPYFEVHPETAIGILPCVASELKKDGRTSEFWPDLLTCTALRNHPVCAVLVDEPYDNESQISTTLQYIEKASSLIPPSKTEALYLFKLCSSYAFENGRQSILSRALSSLGPHLDICNTDLLQVAAARFMGPKTLYERDPPPHAQSYTSYLRFESQPNNVKLFECLSNRSSGKFEIVADRYAQIGILMQAGFKTDFNYNLVRQQARLNEQQQALLESLEISHALGNARRTQLMQTPENPSVATTPREPGIRI